VTTSVRTLRCGDRRFAAGARAIVMGIVNITPDSFSDGGQHATTTAAVDHALRLLDDGADVLDLGGESTRPNAAGVDVDEERRRVLPVVEALVQRGHHNLSIDTRRAVVAAEALAAGASWINDVSGFGDAAMPAACRPADAAIVMHWDTSDAGQQVVRADVVNDVVTGLRRSIDRGLAAGLRTEQLLVDPGLGFSKSLHDNLRLTRDLSTWRASCGDFPIVYGPSRKRFLGELTGRAQAADRDAATIGAVVYAVLQGADVVRVHDVRGCVDALRVIEAMRAIPPGRA
jgi:dihydropteroate synthase